MLHGSYAATFRWDMDENDVEHDEMEPVGSPEEPSRMQPMKVPPWANRLRPYSIFGGPTDPHIYGAASGALINGLNWPAVAISPYACTLRAALGEGWTIQTSPKAVREDDSLPAGTWPAQACLHRADYPACHSRYIGQESILVSEFFRP